MATLNLRVEFGERGALGPGKARLLELIAEHGSIAAAGRAMGMSYRRAWDLVDELNRCFGKPVITTQMGGQRGGGAVLTPLGQTVVEHFRAIEGDAAKAAAGHLKALQSALKRKAG
jgi:molybdate transport system regulatory protein